MSTNKARGKGVGSGRGVLAAVSHALDSLPDAVALALGLGLGAALVVVSSREVGWWVLVLVVGGAVLLGLRAGARPRAEGWLRPALGSTAMLALTVGLLGAVVISEQADEPSWQELTPSDAEPMRWDLGDGGGTDDTTGGASGASEGSGTSTGQGASSNSSGGHDETDGDEGDGDVVAVGQCHEGTRYIAGGLFGGQRVESFCLDTTEVTVAAYEACVKRGECSAADSGVYCNSLRAKRSEHPINCVDWEQAKAFCEGSKGRLPTSEEWEWAARGRESGWTYPWGNEPEPSCERVVMDESASMDDKRWGCDTGATWPVGSKPKGDSLDGVKDLAGNVREWTSTVEGGLRIVCGGSWSSDDPESFRASDRGTGLPASRGSLVGFRCARTSVSTP